MNSADLFTLPEHQRPMRHAIRLARLGNGLMFPARPSVGAVISHHGCTLGSAHTGAGGAPHAEPAAIAMAHGVTGGKLPAEAILYVTLEPCNHHGNTAPCTEAILQSGIRRVFIAVEDPDSRVSGSGIAHLREAGLEVHLGLLRQEAEAAMAGFLKVQHHGKPLVTLKLALTKDGTLGAKAGGWFTNDAAKAHVHFLRRNHDAILVGGNTARQDNPTLTCRLPGLLSASPIRIVLDGSGQMLPTAQVLLNADAPSWLVTRKAYNFPLPPHAEAILPAPAADDLPQILAELAQRGITRLLAEGGWHTAQALLEHRLVDEIRLIHAPEISGDGSADRRPALSRYTEGWRLETRQLGTHRLELYRP